ncbi:MAG: right-handed parallel beta-helix repeat-containing protein [Phycisphaerales bacterium]|nr:right-handed parallel beta-helix repeat-containing protein [Phycisphaerales bacterium]
MRLRELLGLIAAGMLVPLTATPAGAQLTVHVLDPAPRQSNLVVVPTLEDALALVRAARQRGETQPATIVLDGDFYAISKPLEIDGALVGPGLTIEAAPTRTPLISGARLIGAWAEAADGSWRTTIDQVRDGSWWFEELFINGEPATRARHPDGGFARVVAPAPDNRTGFSFDPAELSPALIDTRSEVVFVHDWSISRVMIGAVDAPGSTLTTTHPIGCKAPHFAITNFEPNPRYFIEGSPLLVNAPGEWALDQATGGLTYMPRPGESIGSLHAVAPVAPALLIARGTPDAPIRNLTLRGIRFAHTSWPKPSYGYAEGQAAFYEQRDTEGSDGTRDAVPSAIDLTWAEGCTIDRCTIEQVGGTGVWIGEGSRNCTITDTVVRECGANGVMLGEAAGRVVNGRPWWQNAPAQAASGNTLRYSLIERCGRRFFGAVGVWVGLAAGTTIANCEIRDLPYTGVSIGWRWDETPTPCAGNVVENCHIHHVMQTLSDGGGIYTLGLQPGTVLRGNAIHDIARNTGRAPSNGMFLDQGTTGIVIEGNTFWAIDMTPIRWHWSYKNTVRNNTFVLREGQEVFQFNRATADDIAYEANQELPAAGGADPGAALEGLRFGPREP